MVELHWWQLMLLVVSAGVLSAVLTRFIMFVNMGLVVCR